MDISTINSIILVLVGALTTFLLTLLASKIQRKRPILIWRKLSNIEIPANQLTGVNWLIENQGSKYADNVNILIKLPDDATFETLDCVSSELALEFTANLNDLKNVAKINIPIFPHNISLDISSLVKSFSNKIEISIIGEGIVGKKHNPKDKTELVKKYSNVITVIILTTYTVGIMCMFGFIAIMLNSKIEYEQTRSIANIYIKSGEPEEAIKLYKHFNENTFLMKKSPSLMFEAMRIYAETNKIDKLIPLILKLTNDIDNKNAHKYIYFLKSDASLDKFRSNKDFISAVEAYEKKFSTN